MATLDHVSEHLATLDIKSDVQKATSGHLATLAHVERDVQKAMSEHPNTRPVQDPSFTGWINWAAFHLEEPKDTMRMLRGPDVYLAMQYIFARFAVHSLIGRSNVSDGRFQYVTTIVIQLSADRKSFHVTSHFQSDIQNNVHKVGEAFAVQVHCGESLWRVSRRRRRCGSRITCWRYSTRGSYVRQCSGKLSQNMSFHFSGAGGYVVMWC